MTAWWERIDTWPRPRPPSAGLRRDALLAVGLAAAGLVAVELMRATSAGASIDQDRLTAYLGSLAITLPLALRRRFPIVVMTVCSIAFYVIGQRLPVASASLVVQVAYFMSIYAAWAWARHRLRLLVVSSVIVLAMFVWVAQLIATHPVSGPGTSRVSAQQATAVLTVALNVLYFLGAIAWGSVSHAGAHRRQLLEEQAEQLRREQARNAERAVAEDRLRIARDLHDAVAHHVTGIGVQAAAARHVLDRDPDGSRTALVAIEESSRSAVEEMHHMVGLLRQPGEADELVGLVSLRRLAEPSEGDRLQVTYREVGEPFAVPAPIGTAVFRAAQEALTNVRRHSTAHSADMVLRYLESGVEVEVIDEGRPRRAVEETTHGYGLRGVRERAAMHDGVVEVGPRPEGGFRLRVRFRVAREVSA